MKRQTLLKSTLCLLMALLCNVAWAQTSFTFTRGESKAATVTAPEGLTATMVTNVDWLTSGAMSSNTGVLCPNENTKDATAETPITFTLTVSGLTPGQEFTAASFTHKAVNSSGQFQSANNETIRHCNLTLTAGGEPVATLTNQNIWVPEGSANHDKVITFDNVFTADAEGNLTLTLTIAKGTTNDGCFYGLTKVELHNTKVYTLNFISGAEVVESTTITYIAGFEVPEDLINDAIPEGYHMLNYKRDGATYTVYVAEGAQNSNGPIVTFTNVQQDGTTTFTLYINENNELATSSNSAAELGDAAKFRAIPKENGKWAFYNESKGLYMIWRGKSAGHNGDKGVLAEYDATYCDWTMNAGTVSGTYYFVGRRKDNSDDGSLVVMKSSGAFDAWRNSEALAGNYSNLYKIESEEYVATLTDNQGTKITCTTKGLFPLPNYSTVALSNTKWANGRLTATVDATFPELPFPVSSAEETNPTFISSFKDGGGNYQGAGRFKWYAVEDNDENDYDDVKIQRDAIVKTTTLASYSWAIYPSLENGAFAYSIKNIMTGTYIKATKSFAANQGDNNEGTIILSDTPTKFSLSNDNSRLYYYENSRNQYFSWGSVNTASGFLGVHTNTHDGATVSFHEPIYELTKKADLESGAIYTFVTNRGWVGADERSTNLIGTAKSGLDPAPTPSNDNPMFQWALYQSQNGNYYLYNLGKKQFMGVQSADKGVIPFTETPTSKKLTFKDNGDATYPIMFSTDNQHAVTQNTASGLFGWKEGWNKTNDGGSNHKVTYIGELGADDLKTIADLVEAYDIVLPATVTYTVDKENGDLYRDNGAVNQTWNRDWKSKGEPQLVLSTGGKNNMDWQGNNVELMTGDGTSTNYTLTAPEGYVITEYSFTFANNNHQTGLSLTMYNGDFYTTSTTPQTISEKNVYSSSVSFVLKGANSKGVILTDFTVTVKKVVAEMPQFSTNEKQYWYYITSASTAGYCAGKVMYYDSNNQSLRFASKEFNGDYLWSFWKEGDKIAIKSYNGQYIGNGTNSDFGVVNEANYSYYIKEAYDFFIIKDDGTEMHAQENGSVIVRYGATDGGASLWNFYEADITNADAVLRSTKVEQGKVTTGIGNTHQPIIRSTIRVSGLTGNVNFQGVKGAFSGTNKADVTNVKAYFATNDRELWLDPEQKMTWREENGEQFGEAVALAEDGTFTITGNKALTSGNHYLWITYDIAETAKEGNLVDASITSYTIDDEDVTERNGNPSHSATIFLSEGAVLMPMDKGSLYYRIPAITVTTKDGVDRLVVLTDDRKNHNTDLPSHCYLVAQYSDDNGKTWSEPVTVAGTADTGGNYGHGDASIVTDRNTGNIIGIMTSCGTYGHGFFQGTAEQPPLWKTIISEDGGETWSTPVDHTASLFGAACDNEKTKTWKSGFSGSGAALQKRDGTLVSSFVNREADNSQHFYLFMSKDGGNNWYVSGTSGTSSADEPKTLERNNGDLAISVRASGYNYHNVTSDNGATWHNPSQTRFNTGITGNACDGEYMVWCSTLEGNPWNIALQTLPNSGSRENVSIALSTDEGETFGAAKTICPRGSAYSATVVLPDGTLGVYYEENGLYGGYTMRFVRFSLDWASNGTYKFTNENPFKPIESVDPATVSTSINEHKIGTFYANDPVVIPEGVKAYVATEEPVMENGAGVITMTDLEGIIPAHTGVVLRAEKGDYTFKQAATNGGFVNGNMMRGYAGIAEYKMVDLPTDGSVNYVLTVMDGKAGFYRKETGFKVKNNKAYLNVPGAAGARALYFNFDNGATGIVETENESEKTEIYDLAGRRVQKVQRGLYIVNGKKVLK